MKAITRKRREWKNATTSMYMTCENFSDAVIDRIASNSKHPMYYAAQNVQRLRLFRTPEGRRQLQAEGYI